MDSRAIQQIPQIGICLPSSVTVVIFLRRKKTGNSHQVIHHRMAHQARHHICFLKQLIDQDRGLGWTTNPRYQSIPLMVRTILNHQMNHKGLEWTLRTMTARCKHQVRRCSTKESYNNNFHRLHLHRGRHLPLRPINLMLYNHKKHHHTIDQEQVTIETDPSTDPDLSENCRFQLQEMKLRSTDSIRQCQSQRAPMKTLEEQFWLLRETILWSTEFIRPTKSPRDLMRAREEQSLPQNLSSTHCLSKKPAMKLREHELRKDSRRRLYHHK